MKSISMAIKDIEKNPWTLQHTPYASPAELEKQGPACAPQSWEQCRSGTPALPCFTGDAERPCLVKISSTLNTFLGLQKQFEKHCPKAVTAVL